MLKKRKKIKKKEKNKLEDKWMIVKKEKMSTKIKNYFKNIFSKMFNNTKKNKKKKENHVKREYVPEARKIESQPKEFVVENKRNDNSTEKVLKGGNKEITVEFVGNKRKPKEITIEYENKGPKKKKELVNVEALMTELSIVFQGMRQELLSRDDKLKTELDTLYGIEVDVSILNEHTTDVLNHLSRYLNGRAGSLPAPGGNNEAAGEDGDNSMG